MTKLPSTPGRATRLPFFVHRCVRKAGNVLDSAGVRDEPVLLGVSGGGDSMALLEIAGLLAPRLGLQLHVACVDHGLRPEAAAESRLARAAALRWSATFHSLSVEPEGADEDSLRRARHAALEALRLRTGCRFVLLGHTSDDQVETIVFRFLRGAGLGGLSGMREVRGTLLRPLLGIRRAELRRLLAVREVEWAEDPTNQSHRYARGRLRAIVLPAVEAAFGAGALEHLLDVAPRWRDDEDYLEREASRLMAYASRRGASGIELDAEALAGAHRAMRSRVLRRWLRDATGRTPSSRDVAAIERWLETGGGRRGHLDLAGARLTGADGRLSFAVAAGTSPAASPVALDQGSPGRPGDEADAPPDGRDENAAGNPRKAVLPPSEARVRFPRN